MGVLIPVWCNWNCVNSVMDWVWSLVLIPVWCNWNHPDVEIVGHNQCFNSCMVQLKFSHWLHLLSFLAIVLIPVWCNWNAYRSPGWCAQEGVLIPVWCNWNAYRSPGWWAQEEVLIPVWCNWNVRLQGDDSWNSRFNSCMVQLKSVTQRSAFSPCIVLIPVWCNWNDGFPAFWDRGATF